MFKKKHPLYIEMWKRGLRSFYVRNLDSNVRKPAMAGRIVCHLVDFEFHGSLVEQLDFLTARDIRTFRIYTSRSEEVAALLAGHDRFEQLSTIVIPVQSALRQESVWKLIDNFNFSLPPDHWSLVLRTGEFLQYPYFETRTLPDLCQFLFDEGRRAFFALTLDLYPASPSSAPGLGEGSTGWVLDRYGYSFGFDDFYQLDRWHGGFLYRFPEHLKVFDRSDLSRVPLVRAGYRTLHTKDLRLALPRSLNLANSRHHLSPTGCIVSDHAYCFWKTSLKPADKDQALNKLTSAAQLPMVWRHLELIEAGFMNPGQWL